MIQLLDTFVQKIPTLQKVLFPSQPLVVVSGEGENCQMRLEGNTCGVWFDAKRIEAAVPNAPSYLGLLRFQWPKIRKWAFILGDGNTTVEISSPGVHVLESGATFP